MKKIVLLLALFSLALQTTSCKSKKTQDDTEIVENADVEKIEAEDAALVTDDNLENNIGPVDDSLQAALGETSGTTATDPALEFSDSDPAVTETASTEVAPEMAAAPTLDETTLETPAPEVSASTTPTEPVVESFAGADAGVTESPVIAEQASDAAMSEGITESPVLSESAPMSDPAPVTASEKSTVVKSASTTPSSVNVLKKISETTPYQFNEGWVNTVYIARPKEKLKDISQKIYGMDKTKDLKKINSYLASRPPKGGDKIYYVSPNRPSDSMKTVSFYEDTGMIAETYVAQKGDNLKKVAKNLLGYSDAYKEIWTTNSVASKNRLEAGETLRYWAANTAIANHSTNMPTGGAQIIESANQLPSQPIAQEMTPPPPPPPAELPPPPPPPSADMLPPPDQMAQNTNLPPPPPADIPPPPPVDTVSAADAAAMTPPPPPPPMDELAAAPVEPKKKIVTPNMEEETSESEAMNPDTTMMLGGVVVLCSLLAFALIRRNKKKKEIEMAAMAETNVGT